MDKHCGRLDYDLNRVRIASGELPAQPEPIMTIPTGRGDRITENIRTAMAPPDFAPSPPNTAMGPSSMKRKSICASIN